MNLPLSLFIFFTISFVTAKPNALERINSEEQWQVLETWPMEMRGEIAEVELIRPRKARNDMGEDKVVVTEVERMSGSTEKERSGQLDNHLRSQDRADNTQVQMRNFGFRNEEEPPVWDPLCSMECDQSCNQRCKTQKFESGHCVAVPKCVCECV